MVAGVSRNDPLCDFLEEWGIKWPLSSVGLEFRKPTVTLGHPGEETQAHPTPAPSQLENSSIITGEISWDLCGFWEHATLRRLYLDRIIILKDLSRLSDARVALEVREALGSYPSLVPDVARRLRETDNVIVASGNSNTVSNYLSFNPSLGESIAPPYNDSSR